MFAASVSNLGTAAVEFLGVRDEAVLAIAEPHLDAVEEGRANAQICEHGRKISLGPATPSMRNAKNNPRRGSAVLAEA